MSNVDQNDRPYVELAKIAQQSIEGRRAYEWKLAFGLWTAIGVTTYFLAERPHLLTPAMLVLAGLIYLAVVLVWFFLCLVPLHGGHETDKGWKHYYMDRAEGVAHDRPPEAEYWHVVNRKSYWLWGETIVTVLFLFASFMVICNARGGGDSGGNSDSTIHVDARGGDVEVISKAKRIP